MEFGVEDVEIVEGVVEIQVLRHSRLELGFKV